MRQIVSTNEAVELAISKETGSAASNSSENGAHISIPQAQAERDVSTVALTDKGKSNPSERVGNKKIMARSVRTADRATSRKANKSAGN